MPPGSLIPDRQLTFSPDLAATIGLEEAILLQGLGELLAGTTQSSQCVALSEFERNFPFWEAAKIRELLARLEALGIILVRGENQNSDVMRISAVSAQSSVAVGKTEAAPPGPSTHYQNTGLVSCELCWQAVPRQPSEPARRTHLAALGRLAGPASPEPWDQ